jgi:hypothetical protein
VSPKVAVVILVVIVVVFVVALSTNLLPKDNNVKHQPAWLRATQGGLVYHRPLPIQDVTAPAGCISNGDLVVPPLSSCLYSIKPSGIPARRVMMKTGSAHITIYNGDKPLPGQDANPPDTIDVMSGGGKLLIVCTSLATCELDPSSAD